MISSGSKKIIVLSGPRGIGKSTICRKIVQYLRDKKVRCGGFITYKSRDSGIIIEDVGNKESMILASTKPEYQGPATGRYYFSSEGLEFGLKALKTGLSGDVLFVDELGHLEARGEGFALVFDYLRLNSCSCVIAVIREELLSTLLPHFITSVEIIRVDKENRNRLAETIVTNTLQCIASKHET